MSHPSSQRPSAFSVEIDSTNGSHSTESLPQQPPSASGNIAFDPLFGSDGSSNVSMRRTPIQTSSTTPVSLSSSSGLFSRMYAPQRRLGPKKLLGNSTGCCGNHLVFPRDAAHSLCVVFLVLLPTVVFLTSIIPKSEWWSFAIVGALTLAIFVSLFLCVGLDPGILPPETNPSAPARTTETVVVKGTRIECSVCPTCNIVRPPRSSHCAACDYCVEDYDHHCGVLGSCVAKRTFRFFAYFFYFTALSSSYVFSRCVYFLVKLDWSKFMQGPFERWQIVAAFGEVLYCGCIAMGMYGQAAMYTKMACDNSNMKINVRGFWQQQPNPWDEGGCTNYFTRMCGPLGPSLVIEETS